MTKTLQIALKKCTKFYKDAVHADCTPAEYLELCKFFKVKPSDFDYYKDLVASGISKNGHHYIYDRNASEKVMFPVHKFAILDCNVSR